MRKRPKHEPTSSHSYLSRQVDKCMMRAYTFKFNVESVRMQTTNTQRMKISEMNMQNISNLNVCSTENSKSKGIIADENSSQVCFTDEREPEIVITKKSSTE